MAEYDPRELENWLAARGASKVCPVCSFEDEWVYGETLGGIPHVQAKALNLEHGYQVAVLFCQRCGFMRFHALEAFKD